MLLNKESFKTAFIPEKELTEKQIKIIDNLVEIANIFISKFRINSSLVYDNLIALFIEIDDLNQIINAKNGEQYTSELLSFITSVDFTTVTTILSASFNFQVKGDVTCFFQNILDLFEIFLCKIQLNVDYLIDYLAIANVLRNQKICEEHMNNLEKKLQVYAQEKGLELISHDGKLFFPTKSPNMFSRHKLLSGWLYQWAQENNFNKHFYAKVTGLLIEDQFLGLLKNNIFFKDDGAPARHGQWPHAIQWYIVVEENKKSHFLKHNSATLYQDMGKANYLTPEEGRFYSCTMELVKPESAWDLFFDRIIGQREKDYRVPEKITISLRQDAQKSENERQWPLLSESIIRAFKKRQIQDKDSLVADDNPIVFCNYDTQQAL